VVSEPELCELQLTIRDKFIVLATDGIWEYMSNKEGRDLDWPHYILNTSELAA
jgi:serine/threonine protein phosphatase PrpC